MRRLDFGRMALCSCAAAAMLSGCGAAQPPIGAPGAMPQSQTSATAAHAKRGGSWMLPEAKTETLLYAADARTIVYVYSYPDGKLVGELTGLAAPFYLCSDKNGDVFVPNSTGSQGVYEYAHGGTQPINVFDIPSANACSVDPTTGNLAIAPLSSPNVYVFPAAQGNPVEYTDANIYFTSGIAYDGSGNLFLDGELRNNHFFLLELRSNDSGNFETINVPYSVQDSVFQPIQWDGTYLDIGTAYKRRGSPRRTVLDRLAISGSSANIAGTVKLAVTPNATHPQFWIHQHVAIQPAGIHKSHNIDYFKYPSGRLIKTVKGVGTGSLWGITVSFAPSLTRIRR